MYKCTPTYNSEGHGINHYPRHVGDFIRDTVGLSLAERGAYTALLDQYYASEKPLPLDQAERYRMATASSKGDRAAVDYVVTKYFTEQTDGWHQKRADEEIAFFLEGAEQETEKREHEAERQRRHRIRRRELFATLRERGIVPDWDASMTALERLCHAPVTRTATANQEPEPVTNTEARTKTARKRATSLPPGFAVSEQVRSWAAEKGYGQLDAHLEAFVGRAKAKGYRYEDWDQALQNSIREDWPKLRISAGRVESLTERRVANMADITGRNRERTINASAVDRAPVRPALGDLRESDDSDVG